MCYFGPPVAPPRVDLEDEQLLLRGDVAAEDVGAEIVEPPEPAALACSLETLFSSIILLPFLCIASTITSYIVFDAKESITKAGKAPLGGSLPQAVLLQDLPRFPANITHEHRTFQIINPFHTSANIYYKTLSRAENFF